MNSRRILTAVLGVQLLIATTSSSLSQTNRQAVPVLKQYSTVSDVGTDRRPETVSKKADSERDSLLRIRGQAARSSEGAATVTNDTPIAVGNLEGTGQYVERFVRIPEGNSGTPKLVRFLIPVYREKSTKPETSVGTGDKQEQNRQGADNSPDLGKGMSALLVGIGCAK